jgi:hypothetical protein
MRRFGLVLIAALTFLGESRACSIPVFRYALENWVPSKYELICVYSTKPFVEDIRFLDILRDRCDRANVQFRPVDVARELDPATRKLIGNAASGPFPHLILRYPDSTEQIPPVWTGPFEMEDVRRVFESPAREQLIARLKQGYATVVLLLLSGDEVRDAAARAFLAEHLPRLAGRIELPKKSDEGPQVTWDAPVRVEFPVIEVARTSTEEVFVQMLLGSEDGLKDVTGPIAFPVFGRGRALCSLHGRDLEKPSELQRSLEFLCKACSCQAKELNPGLDLLISTDWNAPPETISSAEPVAIDRPVKDSQSAADSPALRPRDYAVAAAGLAVVLSGIWVLRSRRRPG